MANPEHLKILEKGVRTWNNWRLKTFFDVAPDLRGTDLHDTHLGDVNLEGVRLEGANLQDTTLIGSNLRQANLSNADLSGADIRFAQLSGAELAGANFLEAYMGSTTIGNVDLSKVKNLESVIHLGPSSVGIDTIYASDSNIPEKFLRGCGVPDEFITYMRSLTGRAIEFYSCFISYSSKDEEFAERLYADLQSKGVRCWFAREDLKIGDRFRVRIDEAVRLHDKLLLVLSENSVSSEWVGDEVEAAIEKERVHKKTVLFPVRLDDAVMEVDADWPATIRRSRHIGDFSDWKNHDSYRQAFERLMRDLKAEARRES